MLGTDHPSFSGQTFKASIMHRLLLSAMFTQDHHNWTGVCAHSVGC